MTHTSSGMPVPSIAETVPLDRLEHLFCRTYDATGDAMAAHILELEGLPDEVMLRAAVRDLQVRHPRLRATIAPWDHSLQWHIHSAEHPPELGVDFFDVSDDEPRWQDVVHRCLNEGVDLRQGPGMRLVVLRDREHCRSRLFTVLHHAVSSGNLIMLHDVLHYYEAQQIPPLERPPITPLPFLSLGYNCVAKAPWDATRVDRLRGRWLRYRREVLARGLSLPQAAGRRAAPVWEARMFTPGETTALVRVCRRHRVSTVGMILAAGLVTQRNVLGRKDMVSVLGCPLDIRSQFEGPQGPITIHDLGNFVTRMVRPYRIGKQTDFWRLASRISQDTNRALGRGLSRDAYALTHNTAPSQTVRHPIPAEAEQVAHRRPHLDVHQAGVAPFRPVYANLRIKACIQVVRRVHSPSGFLLRIGAITLQNRLQIYLDPVEFLDPDFVAAFHRELVSTLIGIAEDG